MKHVFYSLGITSFLVCMIFSVTTSITNPFYGMSEAAVAQATTYTYTTSSGETTTVMLSINPFMYEIYVGNTTYSTQKKRSTITPTGSANVGYKGFIGLSGSITVNPEERTDALHVNLGDQVNCINGGYKECYKTPGKPTNVYF